MERKEFITNILLLTGGAYLYGCKNPLELVDENSSDQLLSEDTILEDALNWFKNDYLVQYSSSKGRKGKASVNRILNWSRAKTVKSKGNEFSWIPIDYLSDREGEASTSALLAWKEGQEYVQKLAKYLCWTVAEGFLIYKKPNGEFDGYLSQVAYDSTIHKPGEVINTAKFTGMILNSDWEENTLRLWHYEKGKLIGEYDNKSSSRGRTQDCITYYVNFIEVTGQSCGPNCQDITLHIYRTPTSICYTDGGGNPGSGGYPYYNNGDGSGGGGWNTPSSGYSTAFPYPISDTLSSGPAQVELINRSNRLVVIL